MSVAEVGAEPASVGRGVSSGLVSDGREGDVAGAGVVLAGALDEWVAGLREQGPSAQVAGLLDELDLAQLSARGRIDALVVLEQHLSWLQAKQVQVLAAIAAHADTPEEMILAAGGRLGDVFAADWDTAVEEVACALRLANVTAARRLEAATLLADRHDTTTGLLAAGQISYVQAQTLAEQLQVVDDSAAAQVEQVMAVKMPTQAAGQTRAALRREIHRADPEEAEQRHRQRVRERGIKHYPQEDGMALFGAVLPAQQAALMERTVDSRAQGYADDGRSLEQKRADALFDLVVNQPGAVGGSGAGGVSGVGRTGVVVQVTVPFDILVGEEDGPAELKGYGPVAASQARELAFAPGSVWRRLLTAPETGLLIKTDPTTYRPTAETERHVIARDQYCAFPSCRMPAHRCDLDHVRPFDHRHPERGGPTVPENLQPLCRRHHRLKTHHPGWRVSRDLHTGISTWTAPTGHTYTNTPPVYRE
ncbi:HNH endonuclease signature motif containing protein [Streptomyces regalis]|uniref:HNH endonuclease signature motif containing protein n=1 Tax=Streptomyces regalis TaxID=68262 RepID=UPI000AF44856|nr:HNH endonuclease signature motif containing protein [Streptomyces regalis]